VRWNDTATYGDIRQAEELEFSVYDFEAADPATCRQLLDLYEGEAARLLSQYPRQSKSVAPGLSPVGAPRDRGATAPAARTDGAPPGADTGSIQLESEELDRDEIEGIALAQHRFPLRKVYDLTLKCSHLFNILDARGAISVTERVALIARVRKLACEVAAIYLDRRPAVEVIA
jgi:glycyl-tRNA synthetase alpha chain